MVFCYPHPASPIKREEMKASTCAVISSSMTDASVLVEIAAFQRQNSQAQYGGTCQLCHGLSCQAEGAQALRLAKVCLLAQQFPL